MSDIVEGTKHFSWKWFGALLLEPKSDGNGKTHLAVSLTRLQKLVSMFMAVVLFVVMIVLWIVKPEFVAETGLVSDPIPNSMLWVFAGLAGLKGVESLAGAIWDNKNATNVRSPKAGP